MCSTGGRTGFQFWMGIDRPSPDYAHAKVIYLISAHLETGHYFNPHAQRITEARENGAKVIVLDTRLSNTATHADYWLSPQPGSEAAMNLAIASYLIRTGNYDAGFVRRWWNWERVPDRSAARTCRPRSRPSRTPSPGCTPGSPSSTPPPNPGSAPRCSPRWPRSSRTPGRRFACPFLAVRRRREPRRLAGVADPVPDLSAARRGGHRGRHVPERLEQVRAAAHPLAAAPRGMAGPVLAAEFPLAQNEMCFLLPHFLKDGRGRLDTYFIRVYNPVWTNPDGLPGWKSSPTTEKIGCFVALTPTWNESAYFADYVLPMGHGSERHDTHSYEQYDGQWIGFRQPVLRAARERLGEAITDTRQVNPGEVWEENECWTELSWRIDPDGSLGIRQYHESRAHARREAHRRRVLRVDVREFRTRACPSGPPPRA